jgi:hypothetical protein
MKTFTTAVALLTVSTVSSALPTGHDYVRFTQDERGTPMVHVIVDMARLFPSSLADLSGFNLDVGYTNYNTTLFQQVADDFGNTAASPDTKVVAAVSVLHGKEYRKGVDAYQDEDFNRLSALVNPGVYSDLIQRQHFTWATDYAINLVSCSAFLSCISGTTCGFDLTVDSAPRSRCESQGEQNCCISWSTYDVKADFFEYAWITCYYSRPGDVDSCEGHDDGSGQGGDVCFSNRANGCA